MNINSESLLLTLQDQVLPLMLAKHLLLSPDTVSLTHTTLIALFYLYFISVLVAPKIDRRYLHDVTVSAGSPLKFEANIIGEPPPSIEWRYNGITLKNDKRTTIDNPDYSTKIAIRPVNRDDTGQYTVTASNSSGKDTHTINVTVTDKPTPPQGPLQISDVNKNGCKLKWKRPKDDGGTPIEYYQVDKMDPETGCWVPCGRASEPSKFNFKSGISDS